MGLSWSSGLPVFSPIPFCLLPEGFVDLRSLFDLIYNIK